MLDERARLVARFIVPLRVKPGSTVTMARDFDPGYKASFHKKKDGTAVLEAGVGNGGVNPQGVHVSGFKVSSSEELNHDYLWRYAQRLPGRGEIGIFNRSHYEQVLVVWVHPELLNRQRLPAAAKGKGTWARRYREINDWAGFMRSPELGAAFAPTAFAYFLIVSIPESRSLNTQHIWLHPQRRTGHPGESLAATALTEHGHGHRRP
jgi:Polyphosphate kinase 2 (PPK2)